MISRAVLYMLSVFIAGCSIGRPVERIATYIDPDSFLLEITLDAAAVVIDVRLAGEYSEERIAGAINVPDSASLRAFAETLPHRPPVYIYCEDNNRSEEAAAILSRMDFSTLYILDGGINRWKVLGLPVEHKRDISGLTVKQWCSVSCLLPS